MTSMKHKFKKIVMNGDTRRAIINYLNVINFISFTLAIKFSVHHQHLYAGMDFLTRYSF